MKTINATILAYTPEYNLVTIWTYRENEHPVTGYFQATTSYPYPIIGDEGEFNIICKKSEKGAFYNKILKLRKE